MAKSKFTVCKTCGGEIAKSAKACPHCGAPHKQPFYKRWWFWCLFTLAAAAVVVWQYWGKIMEEHKQLERLLRFLNR